MKSSTLVPQTITPLVTATETFGAIIPRDPLFLGDVLFAFENEVDKAVTCKVYGSNSNDSTMVNSVLLTTIPNTVLTAGSVTRTTAGYHLTAPYTYLRVSAESDGAPTGNFYVSALVREDE